MSVHRSPHFVGQGHPRRLKTPDLQRLFRKSLCHALKQSDLLRNDMAISKRQMASFVRKQVSVKMPARKNYALVCFVGSHVENMNRVAALVNG